jgi:ATP adenylyltransferase
MSERPLWAPWRIEYITGPKDDECVFCHPESALDRGRRCFTMLNAYPYAPGHVMVAPYRHVAGLEELDDDELLDMMRLARRAVLAVKQAMAPAGFNTGLNLGKVAGAGIAEHLHMHVVPRWEGDFNFMPLLADTHVIPEALEATREQLTEALRKLE